VCLQEKISDLVPLQRIAISNTNEIVRGMLSGFALAHVGGGAAWWCGTSGMMTWCESQV
jgi:hypothetical protein